MIKFSNVIVGLYGKTAVIQPMWAIDEYAIIFRNWVWFSPPQPPTMIDRMEMVKIIFKLIDGKIW